VSGNEAADAPADAPLAPRIHAERRVWHGARPVDLYDAEAAVTSSRPAARRDWEVVRVGRIAAVLPYDPVRDRLLVIRQFRLAAHLAHGRGANIEVIAGRVAHGEDVASAARREAREEGGVELDALEPMLDFTPVPAALDERATLFLGRADLGAAPSVAGLEEEQETVLPMIVAPAALLEAARAGAIRNGYALLAVAWFMLHKARIDARWKVS
jgi:ADP-ribose pyrophosphatase